MTFEEIRAWALSRQDPLEIKSRDDAQNTREALEALGMRLPAVFRLDTKRIRKRRACRICGAAKRCQDCRDTQSQWNAMQAALETIKNGTDHNELASLDVMSSYEEESA